MRFSAISAMALLPALLTTAIALPAVKGTLTPRSCDCGCPQDCYTDCANGFALSSVGVGFCDLTCSDTCGCGPNTACCEDGTSCEGKDCCDKDFDLGSEVEIPGLSSGIGAGVGTD